VNHQRRGRGRKRQKLSQQQLRELDVTLGFSAVRYTPEGCAEVRQLVPESDSRRRDFARRLSLRDEG
jgi:hypothetical protein